MESVEERLNRLREERIMRERARIEKLRELNLKKYNKSESFNNIPIKSNKPTNKLTKNSVPQIKNDYIHVKNNFIANNTKKSTTVPNIKKNETKTAKTDAITVKNNIKLDDNKSNKLPMKTGNIQSKRLTLPSQTNNLPPKTSSQFSSKNSHILKEIKPKTDAKMNLSKFALKNSMNKTMGPLSKPAEKPNLARKSMVPRIDSKAPVFERLYKPVKKLHKDLESLQQVQPVRRSISAVHLKRINKSELSKCIRKSPSLGDNLNKAHLNQDIIIEEEVTSAIKSERKRVTFLTRMNTPRREDLQHRLENWLHKQGKSLDSYHHLKCFGLHRLPETPLKLNDENKENIALESDSDNDSFNEMTENNKNIDDLNDFDKWRHISTVSESVCNDSNLDDTLTSDDPNDDLIKGALLDLAKLIREGFDWKESAHWLRAIKERYPQASSYAAYWECRAVLEECRGAPFASLHCWEEAIAKGTEQKVAEANLDHLLEKFMQLKINPNSGPEKKTDPKLLVDMNNIFKSSLIRFTITQSKKRQSQTGIVCVTPVRRSGRLSLCPSSKKKVCENMRQVSKLAPIHTFTPNKNLVATP